MERRRGPSISMKMILASTLVTVIVVGFFGVANIISLGAVFDDTAKQLQDQTEKGLTDSGKLVASTLESSVSRAVRDNEFTSLQEVVPRIAKSSNKVSFVFVADPEGTVYAHSDTAKNQQKLTDAAWQAVKGQSNEVVKDRLKLGGEDVLLVGRPISQEAKVVGYIGVGYSLKFLDEELANNKKKKEAQYNGAITRTILIGLLFVLVGTLVAVLQGLRIAKPIKLLAQRADQIARGDLDTRVEVMSSDEIGLLGENFNYMADRLVVLLRETAEKATIEKELEVARQIQDTLVPSSDTIDRGFVRLAGYFQPATQCGGDWWTFHELADGKLLVIIADVTGHGVPSAMITAAAKASCDTVRAMTNDTLTVTYLLEILNRAIYESAKRKFVMTCFASIIDPKARTITYANAGHNFPYLYREVEQKGEFGILMTRGNRLGDMVESKYQAKQMDLQKGDVLVWYTDGIVECENDKGEEYGEKRFRSAIRKASTLDPAEMRESVVQSANAFFGEVPRKDDITMVLARIFE